MFTYELNLHRHFIAALLMTSFTSRIVRVEDVPLKAVLWHSEGIESVAGWQKPTTFTLLFQLIDPYSKSS